MTNSKASAASGATTRLRGPVASLRRDDFDRDVWCLLGLPVDMADINQAVAAIDTAVRSGARLSFVTPNVNWLVRAARDRQERRRILNADLSLIDGGPLVLMARLLGIPVSTRVAGSDLFEALRRRPAFVGHPLKIFFFGGRDGAAEAAAKMINAESNGVQAVGWRNPGYGDVESMSGEDVINDINATAPDFVIVALGAAKGQAWIERNRERLMAPVTAHLGAVIDFTAGGIARAPRRLQHLGLEWAWRIKEEPSLWRRYFEDAIALAGLFLTRVAPQLGRAGRGAGAPAGAAIMLGVAESRIELSGRLLRRGLAPVSDAFRQAASANRPVRLVFAPGARFDRAFLGMLLMLEKHIGAERITLEGVSPAQRRVLRLNSMNYACGAAASAEQQASDAKERVAS